MARTRQNVIKMNTKNRIYLTPLLTENEQEYAYAFHAYRESGKIILEPIISKCKKPENITSENIKKDIAPAKKHWTDLFSFSFGN